MNNLIELRVKTSINILCIDERVVNSFNPKAQLHINKYQFPHLR